MIKKFEPIKHIAIEIPKIGFDNDSKVYSITQKIMTQAVDNFDDAVYEGIVSIAKKKGISDLFLLNKNDVFNALIKQSGCHRPYHKAGDKQAYCPICHEGLYSKLLHVRRGRHEKILITEKMPYCKHCGQKLNWEADNEQREAD